MKKFSPSFINKTMELGFFYFSFWWLFSFRLLNYNEAAAKLESIYKPSSPSDVSDLEDTILVVKRGRRRVKKNNEYGRKIRNQRASNHAVMNQFKKVKRLSLVKRVEMSRKSTDGKVGRKLGLSNEDEPIERLVRQYSVSDVSLDWKKVKIPPVLSASEHTWLFNFKALFEVKENMQTSLGRAPSDVELAEATNTSVNQVIKRVDVGQVARFKLIKHNLRLVLFVVNKYFHESNVWFMAEISQIFSEYGEIVRVTLDNYGPEKDDRNDEREEPHHNWVAEVVRCEGRNGGSHMSSIGTMIRPPPEKKNPNLLTRRVQLCSNR